MATKKRRGLSGSPAEHRARGEKALVSANKLYKESRELANLGICKPSMMTLIDATERASEAFVESEHIGRAGQSSFGKRKGGVDMQQEVFSNERAAKTAFEKQCLVGGGLSGMKRRSRR